MKKVLQYLLQLGTSPKDSEELKIKKSSLVIVPLIIGPAAFIWGNLYIYLDHYLSAAIPLSYSAISLYNLWHLNRTKDIASLQKIQMSLVLVLPFMLMWSLGGFSASSFVFIWAFFAPIAALTYEKQEKASYWFYAFLVLVIISALIDQSIAPAHQECMPELAVNLFYFLNISAALSGIYYLIRYFINEKEKNAKSLLYQEHEALKVSSRELEEANSKLHYLANHDNLTKLPNRYYLREKLKDMIALADLHKHAVALLFLDLDGFKNINDSYGHICGDEVLRSAAQRLQSLEGEDDFVARLGGDEFAFLIGHVQSLEYIEEISNKIIDEVSRTYECITGKSSLGVSIGIATYPESSRDIDSLISNADSAMYEIKLSCKNSFTFYKNRD